jgi:hypothetical protein
LGPKKTGYPVVLTADRVKASLLRNLETLRQLSPEELARNRYLKYRQLGVFAEGASQQTGASKKERRQVRG